MSDLENAVVKIAQSHRSLEGQTGKPAERLRIAFELEKISRGRQAEVRAILDELLATQRISKHGREWLEDHIQED